MKQRHINAILTIALLALTTFLILTALPLASTAAFHLKRQPQESLTALNITEATEGEEDILLDGLNDSRIYLPLVVKQVPKLIAYPGPSNVDFGPGVELPPGTQLTLVGRYRDFVKVQWVDEGGALQAGFVWVALLEDMPEDLPELPKDEVPWVKQSVFIPGHPMEFTNDTDDDYRVYKVFGSALDVNEDVYIQMSIDVETQSPDKSTGVGFENGKWGEQDYRRLGLIYQNGNWFLTYRIGDQYPVYDEIPQLNARATGKIRIHVDKTGQEVKVAQLVERSNGEGEVELLRRSLTQSLYAPTDTMGIIAQIARNATLRIDELSISQAPVGQFQPNVPWDLEGLNELAGQLDMTFGFATDPWNDPFDVKKSRILAREAGTLLPMGDFYWENIHPEPDRYDFALADMSCNFAYVHGMDIHIQPLFYSHALVDWLSEGDYSGEELIGIMRDFVSTVLGRYVNLYPDRRIYVTVVNEAVWEYNGTIGYDDNIFYRVLGEDWIRIAYQLAAEVVANNTNVVLLYGDYIAAGSDEPIAPGGKSRLIANLVQGLREACIPVGFGIQTHTGVDKPFVKDDFKQILKDFAQISGEEENPVQIVLNEMSVKLVEGTDAELQEQARIYGDQVSACLEINKELGNPICKAFLVWGVSDLEFRRAAGILDENYNPKPAYFAIRDAFRAAASQP